MKGENVIMGKGRKRKQKKITEMKSLNISEKTKYEVNGVIITSNDCSECNLPNFEQKHPTQIMFIRWIEIIFALISSGAAIYTCWQSFATIEEVKQMIIQEQTVDVIQARENDVLIKTPDDKWIVVPMIEKDDIVFPNEIIERQYNAGECEYDRKDLFNKANEDWSKRDSFTYTISYISINQNKMVSLHQFINSIVIEFNFYNKERIEHETHAYELYNKELDYDYLNVFYGVTPNVQFVTNEINDGIEDIKINIIIEFEIGGEVFSIPYTFDNWSDVKEDIF